MAEVKHRYDVLTLFPEMFRGPLDESILKRAAQADRLVVRVHDVRDFAGDRHKTTDDYPFGGGAGMVLKVEPIAAALDHARAEAQREGQTGEPQVILMAAQGRRFTQEVAEELARESHLIIICGHYEGVDDRVREHLITDELSIGDYVLTGGELAAMVVIDTVARLIPGVLGAEASLAEESIASGLLEYPQFTRPAELHGWPVPEVLLSGDHRAIASWRRERALERTFRERPDLLAHANLTRADGDILSALVPLQSSSP
jgi:tRNA (guanine37-N1)-methyltransferase